MDTGIPSFKSQRKNNRIIQNKQKERSKKDRSRDEIENMYTIERVTELKTHLTINKADRPLRQIMTEPARES